MENVISRSIKFKLLICFLVVSLLPILVISVLSYNSSSKVLKKEVFDHLKAVNSIQKKRISAYISERFHYIHIIAENPVSRVPLGNIEEAFNTSGMDLANFVKSAEYHVIVDKLEKGFKEVAEGFDFHDILIIDHAGNILYSIGKEADLGTNIFTGRYRDTNLGRIAKKSFDEKRELFADFKFYAPSGDLPAAFISDVICNEKGERRGVVVAQVSIAGIDRIMNLREGMGETGETYLVGQDTLMRSNSRFEEDTILKKKIDTIASQEALDGKEDMQSIKDYRGVPVLSYYSYIEFMDTKWAIISEIDIAEVFRPLVNLRNTVVFSGLFMLVIAAVIALVIASRIASPIMLLSTSANKVADGDLTQTLTIKNKDEIGILAGSFNTMVEELSAVLTKSQDAVNQITSASSEILAASQQQAAGAQEQSAAISETSSAATELSKSAEQVGVNIRLIEKAADHALVGMAKIKEATDKTGDVITSLGEKSRKISKITEVIDDVADQTNLLAVNAAIEAARAGEQGRGFTVVADEMRKLADSTAKSTKDITALIEEIQHEMTNVVMSMEESTSSVGEEIKLAKETSEKSKEISMSANQQIVGAKQISEAMSSINEAMQQIASGAQQSQEASKQLTFLAEKLKKTSSKFKL